MNIRKPPQEIDGARVLYWACSGDKPFFVMCDTNGNPVAKIFGLAVARYEHSGQIYRFSCDANWETENDSACGQDVEHAKNTPSTQYDISQVKWQKFED